MRSVSVIIASYNDASLLEKCLSSIRAQTYDQKSVEIIVADGGSTDNTTKVVKKYKGLLITENSGNPESAKGIALPYAKNEIVLEVDCDTILPNNHWLKDMVTLFDKEPGITGCYTWRYTYRKDDQPLNRYFALFGANDPVAYYLHKTDRHSYLSSTWNLLGKAQDKGSYFLVHHNPDSMPTLGGNGFLIKRELLNKAHVTDAHFYHTDVNWDLLHLGFTSYAVAKNDVIHATGERFWNYFSKRWKYLLSIYMTDYTKRRYHVYDPKTDKKKLLFFCFAALTLVHPLYESIKGYIRIRDWAWFLHPLICLGIFWIYTLATLRWEIIKLIPTDSPEMINQS